MSIIYRILNLINGNIYIGSSNGKLTNRKAEHLYKLRNKKHNNPHLQASFNKYGEDAFSFDVVEELDVSQKELEAIEQSYIIKYNSDDKITGYNIRKPDRSMFTDEFKEARRKSLEKYREDIRNGLVDAPMKGKKHSDDSKSKMSKNHTNPKWSEERKRKFSDYIKIKCKERKRSETGVFI